MNLCTTCSGSPLKPRLSIAIQRTIDVLQATRPLDGRRVHLRESRGGWKFWGLRGTCTRISADHKNMVLVVEECPDDYWPVGMTILVELDNETVPVFVD